MLPKMTSQRCLCLLLVLLSCLIWSSESYNFVVGGRDGWVPNPSENFNHWAGRMRFQVNDTLLFKYKKGTDSVLVVNKYDYDNCKTETPILKMDGGDSVFKFDRSGPFYFISGKNGSCQIGQKLIVVVLAIRNKPKSPPSATTPSPSTQPPTAALSPESPAGSPGVSPAPGSPAGSPGVLPAPGSPAWSPGVSPTPGSPAGSPGVSPASGSPAGSPGASPGPESPAGSPGVSPTPESPAGSPGVSPSPVITPAASPSPTSTPEEAPTPGGVPGTPSPTASSPPTPVTPVTPSPPANTPSSSTGNTPADLRSPPPGGSSSPAITPSLVLVSLVSSALSLALGSFISVT